MSGPMGTGPFAPAGTVTPTGSPLIPLGPVSGATRVPPPATGSASASNSYVGNALVSNSGMTGNSGYAGVDAGAPATALAASGNVNPSDQFRNSLGGMNVIDLTGPLPPPPVYSGQPAGASYAAANSAQGGVIGSGVVPAAASGSDAFVPAQQPADLLRPLDQTYASAPGPVYRGMEGSGFQAAASASVSPSATGVATASSDAWQAPPQVVQATHTRPTEAGTRLTESSRSPGPSTEPVTHTASPSLPWRSPTTAR
ncbi:MAG: hypothetical protein ACO1RT_18625 [Planctomycetaceae bacterium]